MARNECVILSDSRDAFSKHQDSSQSGTLESPKTKDGFDRALMTKFKKAQKPPKSQQEVRQVQSEQRHKKQRANRKKESVEELSTSEEDKVLRRSSAPLRENPKFSRVNSGDKDVADALKSNKERTKIPAQEVQHNLLQRNPRESLKKGLSSNQDKANLGKNPRAAKYKKSEKNARSNGSGEGDAPARSRVKPPVNCSRSPQISILEGNIAKRNAQPCVAYAGPQFQNIPSVKMLPFPILSGVLL